MYIRQKNSDTYVIVSEWVGELSSHPSIIEHPELFEITNEAPDLITSFDEAEGPEALKIALAEINIQTQDWERPTKRPNN